MNPNDSVTSIKGIGQKKAQALEKLNIRTLDDLMFFLPRDYEDRRKQTKINEIKEDETVNVKATVKLIVKDRYKYGRKQMLKLLVEDETGRLEVVFFNAKYLHNSFKIGGRYIFHGKASMNFGRIQLMHPEFNNISENEEGIMPIYHLTKGITQKEMRNWQRAIESIHGQAEDVLSVETIEKNRLCGLKYALDNVHFPSEKQRLLEAKYRLIFDELLVLQTGIFMARQNIKDGKNGIAFSKKADITQYINTLSYPLTGAQQRCVREIEEDLESQKVMNRLVQGDVGSGKTVLAQIAMYKAVKSGYQAVMMAPTEILAKQHFEGFLKDFKDQDIQIGFLSGSMNAGEKKDVLEKIKTGKIRIIIGTHAVLQPEVEFDNLGLVITDEQHRFGVRQRIRLKEKGDNPNVLVMTATPIPRTLSVVLYGDLDVSVIDELPPGRQKTETRSIGSDKRDRCYDFVEKQLDMGRQAYVVAPIIDDSEVMDLRSAVSISQELADRFKNYNVRLLHGAMKQAEKDEIMEEFYEGKIDVIVATVVIEVGINVPNATVIVVENAERFGLAQLHQLRGRVGRGKHKSYCFLITEGESEVALKRGKIMEMSNDGFFIAEEDMKLRGSGEIFGTRQHGLPDLKISDLSKNLKILNTAKEEAIKILKKDPLLESKENESLRRRVIKLFGENLTLDL